MDMINTATNSAPKSPEPEPDTPTRIQQPQITANATKPVSFSNGVLKRHPHHYPTAVVAAVTYKECLKNHAASLGGHALDGCGEFMPSPGATAGDPTSIKCAACGCHRNFHRREPEESPIPATAAVVEYQPHHRHHPPPPPFNRSPNSASPPPISSSYYPSAPHMLIALSTGGAGLSVAPENTAAPSSANPSPTTRKRFRTKFTQEQKEKMLRFAETVGWKMQKRDEEMVQEFCHEAGVDRSVLKVWMHNNKNTFGKKEGSIAPITPNATTLVANGGVGGANARNVLEGNNVNNNGSGNDEDDDDNNNNNIADANQYENDSGANVGTNGSSSSS